MNILEFHFGRPDILLNSQHDKLRMIQEISENGSSGLIEFSMKIQNFVYYIETIRNSELYLSNPTFLKELVNKIPWKNREQWIVHSITLIPYPTIKDFSNWLNGKAQLLSLMISASQTSLVESGMGGPCNLRNLRT